MSIASFTKNKLILSLSGLIVLAVLISNVGALAQPYQRSTVLDKHIKFSFEAVGNKQIHYASSGDVSKPGVMFIHGTPGGWGAFEMYLESEALQRDFFMVSVDRMGWGRSKLNPKQIDGAFGLQATSIEAIIARYPNKQWTLVGHSLGASIAPKVALIAPDSVDSMLLLAGSLSPKLGSPRWYNWAASTWLVSSLIGDSMRYSNREIMGLRKQLKIMDAEIKATKLDAHITIMQGQKDKLVSPKNPNYVLEEWRDNFTAIDLIDLPEEGHFLPWRKTQLVVENIYKLRQLRSSP